MKTLLLYVIISVFLIVASCSDNSVTNKSNTNSTVPVIVQPRNGDTLIITGYYFYYVAFQFQNRCPHFACYAFEIDTSTAFNHSGVMVSTGDTINVIFANSNFIDTAKHFYFIRAKNEDSLGNSSPWSNANKFYVTSYP